MTHPLRIGIAGLGTVGCGVVSILQKQAEMLTQRTGRSMVIHAVSARDASKQRGISLDNIEWLKDPKALALHPDIDVVVELIGGSDGIAKTLCETALKGGKHVVTANKALIAHHGAELARLAQQQTVSLSFEAAVTGGIPIIKLLKEGLAANEYQKITAILNGTANYILSTMEQSGRSFDDVLKEAQEKGYAEADPEFDIDGIDASHKLSILSAIAFGHKPAIDQVYCEGIRHITATDIAAAYDMGYRIRLLGITQQQSEGNIALRVHPVLLPLHSAMAEVHGVYNAVHAFGHAVGDIFIKGQGAGQSATASSVVADVMDIARGDTSSAFMLPASSLTQATIAPMEESCHAYYIRLEVKDTPGVLASITQLFSEHQVSVAQCIQREPITNGQAAIVLMTHKTQEASMNTVLQHIAGLKTVIDTPHKIRIEESSS